MSDKVVELNRRVVSLEKEVLRFERNCVAMQEYQASLLKVAQVWQNWFDCAAVVREDRLVNDEPILFVSEKRPE